MMKKTVQFTYYCIDRNLMLYFYLTFAFMFYILYSCFQNNMPIIDINTTIENIKNGLSINFIPFRTLSINLEYISDFHFFCITLGNILIFLPVGIFIRKNKFQLIIVITTVILKEIVQFVLNIGSFDIDTIILNYLGIFLGMAITQVKSFSYN